MTRPNWRTGSGHVLRWALVAETVVVLHLAAGYVDRGVTYPAPASVTTSVATTHVCGNSPCAAGSGAAR